MFRNRSFRAKMALVLAPPLIVLMAFAALVVRPRLDERSAASENEIEARVALASMQMLDEFQNERDLTLRYLVSDRTLERDTLLSQRELTDARRAEFASIAAGEAGEEDEGGTVDAAVVAASGLDELRTTVDSGTAVADNVYATYTESISTFLNLNRELARSASDVDLTRIANEILLFTQGKETLAQIRGQGTQMLDEGIIDAVDVARLTSLSDATDRFFAEYRSLATAEQKAQFDDALNAAQSAAADQYLVDTIAAGSVGELPDVTGTTWFGAYNAKMESIDVAEDAVFTEFVAAAEGIQSDAQGAAMRFLAITAVAVFAAVAAALVLSRSLTRRLADLSHQAQSIASERLPEVLEVLRNPSPEALASALPEVTSDSTDEIGVMAQSFNTVLRTSVETSINHAQRRAQTLTNILVNLGRRNQALIERQLVLIDTLESTQRDPEVLQGLFQLDHMITSMRRNAENLLVLASDQPARAWTAPVSLLDIVRSATAEVQDMSRIVLDVAARDNVMIAGRFAVDLSHMLAELVENGVSFSPPTTMVSVRSEGGAHHLRLWIIDSGVGMTHSEIMDANERIVNPPDIDELTTDRIGFQVVGRLSRRLGSDIQVQANPGGGVAVCVTVPTSVLDSGGSVLGDAPAIAQPDPALLVVAPDPSIDTWGDDLAAALAAENNVDARDWATTTPADLGELPVRRPGQALSISGDSPVPPAPRPVIEPTPAPSPAPAATAPRPVVDAPAPVERAMPAPAPLAATAFGHPAPVAEPPAARPATGLFSRDEPVLPSPGIVPAPAPIQAGAPAPAPIQAGAPAPAPIPAPTAPAIPVAAQATPPVSADAGLVKRVPGQSTPNARGAEAFDSGQFRRLPVPDATAADDAEAQAARRHDSLSRFQRAVGRGRTVGPDTSATHPLAGEPSPAIASHPAPPHPPVPAGPAATTGPESSPSAALARGPFDYAEPSTGFPERLAPLLPPAGTELPGSGPSFGHLENSHPAVPSVPAVPSLPDAATGGQELTGDTNGGQPAVAGDVDPFDISWISNEQERGW